MTRSTHTRGFSHLELVVVIAIIGILLSVAVTRLLPYIDEAERVSILTLESQIQSTLMTSAAKHIAGGRAADIVHLDGVNPMTLLLTTPDNYAGELSGGDVAAVPPRNWYFDLGSGTLVYRRGHPWRIGANSDSLEDPEFEVRIAFDDRNSSDHYEPGVDELWGVHLHRVAGRQWLAGQVGEK